MYLNSNLVSIYKTESNECHLIRNGRIRCLQIYGMKYSSLKTVLLNVGDRPLYNIGFTGRAGSFLGFFAITKNGNISGTYQSDWGGTYNEISDSDIIYATFTWIV